MTSIPASRSRWSSSGSVAASVGMVTMIRVSRPTGRVPEQFGRVGREQRSGFVEPDPRSPAQRDRLTRHGSER